MSKRREHRLRREHREISLAQALDWGATRRIVSTEKFDADEKITFSDGSIVRLVFRPGSGGGCPTCGFGGDEGGVTFTLTEP